MAIVVEYGPIAGALSLAQQAGTGQGYQIQAQRDLAALQTQNAMQSEIDKTNATEMQDAMAQQNVQAAQAQTRAEMAQKAAYERAGQQLQAQNNQAIQQNNALIQQRLTQQEKAQEALAQAALDQKTSYQNQLGQIAQDRLAEATRAHKAQEYLKSNPDTFNQDLALSKASLADLNTQISQKEARKKYVDSAAAKAADPITGNADVLAQYKDEQNALTSELQGLYNARATASQKLQGGKIGRPAAASGQTFSGNAPSGGPSPYNIPVQPGGPTFADLLNQSPSAASQGQRQVANPQQMVNVANQFAKQLNLDPSDPRVIDAASRALLSQGFNINPLQ